MSEMARRAAQAIGDEQSRRAGIKPHGEPTERLIEIARIGLLAALDRDDEALIAALADAPTFGKLDRVDAQIIIDLIRAHVEPKDDPNA